MVESLLEKAQRLGIRPAGTPGAPSPIPAIAPTASIAPVGESLLQKAQRLNFKPVNPEPLVIGENKPQDSFLTAHPVLKSLGDFTGVTGLAKGAAQLIFLKFTPEGQDLQKQYESGKLSEDEYNYALGGGLATPKEIVGSAAKTGLNIALGGSYNASAKTGAIASELAPVALNTGLTESAKRIATKAATGFAAGGALSTAEAISENKSIGESLKDGLAGGTVSGILGGSLQGVSEVVRAFTAPQLTKKIYDSALGVSKKTAQSGKSPSSELIKNGVVGTAQGIYDKAKNTIDSVDPQISNILSKSEKKVKLDAVLSSLAHGVNTAVGNEGADSITSAEMKQVIESSLPQVRTLLQKKELTLTEANKLRQVMDRTLGDRAFTGATLPFKKDALYDASNSLRRLVQNLEPTTKALFKQYSTSVETIKALNSEMAKPHVLRHMLSLLSAAGGGIPGMVAGLANEGLQTTAAKTATAVGLNIADKALKASDLSITAEIIKRLARLGVQNVVPKVAEKLIPE